jgi:hypothetical protein
MPERYRQSTRSPTPLPFAIAGTLPYQARPGSVYAGSYPGSRALYLYANVARTISLPRMRDFIYALQDSAAGGSARSTLFGGSESDRRDSRQAALTLPDVKL